MIFITKIQIQYYRGFFSEQLLHFGIPDSKPGSGTTLIVGPNNAGKTSVLEALLLINQDSSQRFEDLDRHESNKPKITIVFQDSSADNCEYKMIITNKNKGSILSRKIYDSDDNILNNKNVPRIDSVTSRRAWSVSGDLRNDSQLNLSSFGQNITRTVKPRRVLNDDQTFKMLRSIFEDEEKKKEMDEMLRELIPGFEDWGIDTHAGQDYLKYITSQGTHRADLLGDGTLSLFRICLHLMKDNSAGASVLVIDEPELSLHPVAQTKLANLISEKSANKQIIVCTHSLYFVSWDDYQNGAKFVRLNKVNNNRCVISQLADFDKANYASIAKDVSSNWRQPQLMDIVSKEIMFANRVLFVEGPEDAGLIRQWLNTEQKSVGFNIFGYGVGGFNNINKMLAMARDLNLEKVGALYDGGQEELQAMKYVKQEFKDAKFKFFQLPTDDIRDKFVCGNCEKPCNCVCKKDGPRGCFDDSGKLKPQYKQGFEDIMSEIIEHLKK